MKTISEVTQCKGPHNVTRLFLSFSLSYYYFINLQRGLLEGITVYQVLTLMEIKGFSQCIAANKQQACGLAAAASCGMIAACEFFVCELVLLLLVAATLRLLVAATLRLLVAATLRLLVAATLRLIVYCNLGHWPSARRSCQ